MTKTTALILACIPGLAVGAVPDPIPIAEPTYAAIAISNVQVNYIAPYMWVRFRLKMGDNSIIGYCYKLDATSAPVNTNGWKSALQIWSQGQWLTAPVSMTASDTAWCWQ